MLYKIVIASTPLSHFTSPIQPHPYAWESFDVTHVPLRWLRVEDDSAAGKRWKQWLGQAVWAYHLLTLVHFAKPCLS